MNKLLLLAISMVFAGNAACTDSLSEEPIKDNGATKASSLPTSDFEDLKAKEKASLRRQIAIARNQIYNCMHLYYRENEIKAMGYRDEYDMVDQLDSKVKLLEKKLAAID